MGIAYAAAAALIVPGLLLVFHLLSRGPNVTSQPLVPADPLPEIDSPVADEAERWLRSQSRS